MQLSSDDADTDQSLDTSSVRSGSPHSARGLQYSSRLATSTKDANVAQWTITKPEMDMFSFEPEDSSVHNVQLVPWYTCGFLNYDEIWPNWLNW